MNECLVLLESRGGHDHTKAFYKSRNQDLTLIRQNSQKSRNKNKSLMLTNQNGLSELSQMMPQKNGECETMALLQLKRLTSFAFKYSYCIAQYGWLALFPNLSLLTLQPVKIAHLEHWYQKNEENTLLAPPPAPEKVKCKSFTLWPFFNLHLISEKRPIKAWDPYWWLHSYIAGSAVSWL